MKKITILTACYNEEENIREVYEAVRAVFQGLPQYQYEHLFIDNASADKTVTILKEIAQSDKNVKIIVNSRNFGHIRSPFYGFLQTSGDAVISVVADLQDPPEVIEEFLKKWEEGYKVVIGIKRKTKDSFLMNLLRRFYYYLVYKLSDTKPIKNFTGFGLYDRIIIDQLKKIDDPYPYFRGLISEIGFEVAEIPYNQPARLHGKTKNNWYTLYDMAILGITSHSKVPIRLATIAGFCLSLLSFVIAIIYLLLKLIFWQAFGFGVAPVLLGIFLFSSVQLFFIGLLGEYISAIHTQVMKRPLVVEKERINF